MDLLEAISKRTASIGVIGLGYVGLPLIIEFHKQGFEVPVRFAVHHPRFIIYDFWPHDY
jgi:UDP-N-acetyl-D-mannosaminuronate dehydrogenase